MIRLLLLGLLAACGPIEPGDPTMRVEQHLLGRWQCTEETGYGFADFTDSPAPTFDVRLRYDGSSGGEPCFKIADLQITRAMLPQWEARLHHVRPSPDVEVDFFIAASGGHWEFFLESGERIFVDECVKCTESPCDKPTILTDRICDPRDKNPSERRDLYGVPPNGDAFVRPEDGTAPHD